MITAYSPKGPRTNVTHLAFADDLVVFTRADKKSIRGLMEFLQMYEEGSGQRINRHKSAFYVPSSCNAGLITALTGIPKGNLPFHYLGGIIYKGQTKKLHLQRLVEKIEGRIGGWKNQFLSQGGRLVLLKNVLASYIPYVFAAARVPRGTIDAIHKIFSKFFWGDYEGKSKRVWRKWESIAYPVEENGVGVYSMHDILAAYTSKMWWKLFTGTGPWAKFINQQSNGWKSSFFWPRLKSWEGFARNNSLVGINGGKSDFWTSNWLGDGPLMTNYDTNWLSNFDWQVSDVIEEGNWNLLKLNEALSSIDVDRVLGIQPVLQEGDDVLIWQPNEHGLYTIKTALESLRRKHFKCRELRFVWDRRMPLKISVFMWKLLNNFVPLADILQQLGFQNISRCCFCKNSVESIQHLFKDCKFVRHIWDYFGSLFNIQEEGELDLWRLMKCWWKKGGEKVDRQLRTIIPCLICWWLWKLRNKSYYDDVAMISVGRVIGNIMMDIGQISQATPLSYGDSLAIRHFNSNGWDIKMKMPRRRHNHYYSWAAPSPGYHKLNVDGSRIGSTGKSGCGAVLRDDTGTFLIAECKAMQKGTNFEAEIGGMILGVKMAKDLGIACLEVETDSKALVNLIGRKGIAPWKVRMEIQQLRDLLNSFTQIKISHVYREINAVADGLARLGSCEELTQRFTFASLPRYLKGLIALDRQSFPYLRLH